MSMHIFYNQSNLTNNQWKFQLKSKSWVFNYFFYRKHMCIPPALLQPQPQHHQQSNILLKTSRVYCSKCRDHNGSLQSQHILHGCKLTSNSYFLLSTPCKASNITYQLKSCIWQLFLNVNISFFLWNENTLDGTILRMMIDTFSNLKPS